MFVCALGVCVDQHSLVHSLTHLLRRLVAGWFEEREQV